MAQHKISRFGALVAVLTFGLVPLVHVMNTEAAPLPFRSVRIEHSAPGANTIHIYNFNIPSSSIVGSTVFEYCTNDPFLNTPCTPPDGLDLSAANLDSESGDTGYSVDGLSTTANRLVITRTPAMSNVGPSQYVFSDVINPSIVGTVYVRISLHASTDGSGPYGDGGGVVFGIVRQLTTSAFVPPFLIFCVGVTVAPDCSSTTGSNINLGELSRSTAKTATSQFAGATNDLTGFFTHLVANTMTSGNKIINSLNEPTPSLPGTSQFGLNMRANTNPGVGQEPNGAGSSVLMPDYNIPNRFTLKNGTVTNSPTTTDFNTFTTSYIVNVPPEQPPGVYNTTLTYIATASF